MKNKNLHLAIIAASIILLVINLIFTSDEMDLGFWLRSSSLVLTIIVLSILTREGKEKRSEKKQTN